MHGLLPQNLQYANDTVLIVESNVDLKEMIHIIKEENTAASSQYKKKKNKW